ncbi:hypothetical protein DFH06DRAFT_1140816 [Mycena polygramma]|nr:hypothetical protein DFH06DRAFT_1140816 [Mycena polygramma]
MTRLMNVRPEQLIKPSNPVSPTRPFEITVTVDWSRLLRGLNHGGMFNLTSHKACIATTFPITGAEHLVEKNRRRGWLNLPGCPAHRGPITRLAVGMSRQPMPPQEPDRTKRRENSKANGHGTDESKLLHDSTRNLCPGSSHLCRGFQNEQPGLTYGTLFNIFPPRVIETFISSVHRVFFGAAIYQRSVFVFPPYHVQRLDFEMIRGARNALANIGDRSSSLRFAWDDGTNLECVGEDRLSALLLKYSCARHPSRGEAVNARSSIAIFSSNVPSRDGMVRTLCPSRHGPGIFELDGDLRETTSPVNLAQVDVILIPGGRTTHE